MAVVAEHLVAPTRFIRPLRSLKVGNEIVNRRDDGLPAIVQEFLIVLYSPELRLKWDQLRSQRFFSSRFDDVVGKVLGRRIVQNVTIRFASDEGHVGDFIDFVPLVTFPLQRRLRENVMEQNEHLAIQS